MADWEKIAWEKIPINNLLDAQTGDFGLRSRFDRIMTYKLILSNEKIADRRSKESKKITWLTVIIAVCTLFYVAITGWTAWEMKKSNRLQSEYNELQKIIHYIDIQDNEVQIDFDNWRQSHKSNKSDSIKK